MRKVGIAILGLGTVGEAFFRIIKGDMFQSDEEDAIGFEVRAVFVRDVNKKRNVDLSGITITENYQEIINDPDIHVCIECMGGAGTEQTAEIVEAAIKKGKHIVMSSKKCLAQNMNEIIDLANDYHVQLRFEAAASGAIPICQTIMNMSDRNEINKMYGIVNATTNYVLSLMEENRTGMAKALDIAGEKGITENDASEDIDGWDAAYKMKILARLGMQADIDCMEIHPVSVNSARTKGADNNTVTKQIFYLEKADHQIRYYVGSVELERNSILYHVTGTYNIILVDSACSGLRAYYVKGAGGLETASVMYEDLLDLYRRDYRIRRPDTVVCKEIEASDIDLK